MKGYKVLMVSPHTLRLVSVGAYGYYEKEYPETEEVVGEHLFFFPERKNAVDYAMQHNQVWLVEVDDAAVPAPERILLVEAMTAYYEDFWANPEIFTTWNLSLTMETPPGSFTCSRIRLIRRVY